MELPMMKTTALPLLLTLFLLATPAHANLINGSFSDFAGWNGIIYDGADTSVDIAADPHFNLVAGGIELSNDFFFWEVALFQTFIVPNNATLLSFDFSWSLTNATNNALGLDFIQASIFQTNPPSGPAGPLVDLFPASTNFAQEQNSGSVSFDLSAFAGLEITLEFLVSDGDFDESDTFTLGNINIATSSTGGGGGNPIPAPATLLLMLLGLSFAIKARHRKNR